MEALTNMQREKLRRLVKLGIIEEEQNIIWDPRGAVRIAHTQGIITSWSDDGHYYTLTIPKVGVKRLRKHRVGEFIVDRLLSVKDALNETVEKESIKELSETSPTESNSEQELEKDATEENQESQNYNKLTVKELRDLCKEYELVGYSSLRREELIEMLKEHDALSTVA